jgi:hypothetical protein
MIKALATGACLALALAACSKEPDPSAEEAAQSATAAKAALDRAQSAAARAEQAAARAEAAVPAPLETPPDAALSQRDPPVERTPEPVR